MAKGGKSNDSWAQQQHEKENNAGTQDKVPGIDKKLNGPNRPAE